MKPELIVDAPIIDQKKIWVKNIERPYFDHPFHFHQTCELVWIEKSYGKIIIGDYVGNYYENEVVMKGPGLSHLWISDPVFYQDNSMLCTKATSIYFPPTYIQHVTDDASSIALNESLLANAARGMRLYGATRQHLIQKIKAIRASTGLQQLGTFLQMIDLLTKTTEYEPLASIGYKGLSNEKDIDRFDHVYQFLLKNFHRDITLEEVAGICNISPGAFCKFFKLKTQKTFTRFLNEIRIGHACRLLQNEQYPIKNICYESGYNNPVNFFSFFKSVTGTTPNKYRENLKHYFAVEKTTEIKQIPAPQK